MENFITMNYLYWFSMSICFGYILLITFVSGDYLQSISNSYYMWKSNPKTKNWAVLLFWGWTVLTAFPLMIWWLQLSTNLGLLDYQFLIFLSCAALVFVGTAYGHQEGGQMSKVHFLAAIICALFTQVWVCIYIPYWWIATIITFGVCYVISTTGLGVIYNRDGSISKSKTTIFWLEIGAFILTYLALYILAASNNLM